MIHHIKCWPKFYEAVVSGKKRFEYRQNDRDFKEGDFIVLEEFEYDDRLYTGREEMFRVLYTLSHNDIKSLPEGYVIMSISEPLGLSGVRNQDNLDQF